MVVRILSDLEAATLPPSPGLALPRVYGRNSGASSAEWPLQADRGIAAPQAFRQGQPHVLDQIVFPNNHIQPQEIHPLRLFPCSLRGFPGGSDSKESACNAGDQDSIPGLGRSPGEGNGYPLQYSGLENSMDCIVHGVPKSRTLLSDFQFFTLKN